MHQRHLKEDDYEGQMAKAQLMKIENYAKKLNEMIHDQDELEAWVQAKLSVVAAYMGDVKHYLDYELEKSGENIENKEEIDELFKELPSSQYGRYKVEPSTYEDDTQEAKEILKGVWELMNETEQRDMVIKMKKNGIIGLPGLEEDVETYSAMQYAKGGKTKKIYAVLRSPMGEIISDIEVDREDKAEALRKFREMGINEIGTIYFTNTPPHYY